MTKKTLSEVYDMLHERGDIAIIEASSTRIVAGQLRRHWVEKTINPDGWNPVVQQYYEYASQLIIVMERRVNRKDELAPELGEVAEEFGPLGVWVIFADPKFPLDALIDRLGAVPDNIQDYLARVKK